MVHEACGCRDRLSVMWNRMYGKEKFANLYDKYHACSQLNMMLELTACKRLVIGHTPQVWQFLDNKMIFYYHQCTG